MSPFTADQLARRATGALFFSVFGGAWLVLWLAATQRATTANGLPIGFTLLALVFTGSWVLRRTKHVLAQTPGTVAAAPARREGRLFGIVNAVQWGAVFLAGWLLPRLGLSLYFTPVVALIVGLHFFPLARLFRYRGHYLTGGALLLWALGCLLVVPPPEWQGRVALGTGVILWLSAGYSLGRTVWMLRPAAPTSIPG